MAGTISLSFFKFVRNHILLTLSVSADNVILFSLLFCQWRMTGWHFEQWFGDLVLCRNRARLFKMLQMNTKFLILLKEQSSSHFGRLDWRRSKCKHLNQNKCNRKKRCYRYNKETWKRRAGRVDEKLSSVLFWNSSAENYAFRRRQRKK